LANECSKALVTTVINEDIGLITVLPNPPKPNLSHPEKIPLFPPTRRYSALVAMALA